MGNKVKMVAENLLGRALTECEGMAPEVIEQMEKEAGCKLPVLLKQFYATVGKVDLFMSAFQVFPHPYIVDDKLVFLEENQGVCFWGINRADIDSEEAMVYVCNDIEATNTEWYEEEITLPAFLEVMMYYQCAMGGYEYVGGRDETSFKNKEEYSEFLNNLVTGWEKVVSHNGLVIYQQGHKLVWHFVNGDESLGDTIYISALTEDDFDYFTPYEFADWS